MSGYLSLTSSYDPASGVSVPYKGLTIASTLAWGLGYFGMPHILLRFMGIEDENKLKTSRRIASVWVVISMFVAIFIGIIGSAMTKSGALELFETSSQSETLIVRTAVLLSDHGVLTVIMAGLILLLVFSLQEIRIVRYSVSSLLHGLDLVQPLVPLCCFPYSGNARIGMAHLQV